MTLDQITTAADLVVAAGLPPTIEPVLEAVCALSEDVVPGRVALDLTFDGLLNLGIQETVENSQKDSLKN